VMVKEVRFVEAIANRLFGGGGSGSGSILVGVGRWWESDAIAIAKVRCLICWARGRKKSDGVKSVLF